MAAITIEINDNEYTAMILPDAAPESVDRLMDLLPLEAQLQHVRWSGYATWVNLERFDLSDLPRENHTVYPSRGDILLYPGYRNDPELLIACGPTCFKSPAGEIAGNHVATLDATETDLAELERLTLADGQQPIRVTKEDT